jgi:hypothetical protein
MNNREEMSEGMTPKLPLWSYQVQSDSKLAVRTRKDLEIHLITRALKDEGFRQELLANPKEVVEKELGTKLPEDLEINVLEETEDTLYMVLPCNPYEGMSEEELKATLGMTYEDVARWVLEQQRNTFLDEASSVAMIAQAWRDKAFKQELLNHPIKAIEDELGEKVQEKIKIEILVETVNTIYIVFPSVFDLTLDRDDVNTDFINMPMVIGSHADTTTATCDDERDTHITLCQPTFRAFDRDCQDNKTSTSGFWNCDNE